MYEYSLSYRGYPYSYRVYPNSSSQYAPVMFLGGALQSMDTLGKYAAYFSQRTTVVLVDPPGAGKSSFLPASHGADFLADCVRLVLHNHGIPAVNLIGISYGTPIAYRVAQLHGECVERLFLMGTMSRITRRLEESMRVVMSYLDANDLEGFAASIARATLNYEQRDRIQKFDFAEKVLGYTTDAVSEEDRCKFLANCDRLLLHRHIDLESPPAMETLVCTGEFDHFTPPLDGLAVAARLPNSWFTTIRESDHLVGLERFDVSTRLADTFFSGESLDRIEECRTMERFERPVRLAG